MDPIVALTFLAARTSTISLCTGVLILPQRHPVQLAKELASLDVLSGGRLTAGVGVGYVEPELRALGVEPASRARRAEEYLAVLRCLWCDKPPRFSGEFVSLGEVDAYPRPTRATGIPIVMGGNSQAGIRRAASLADGWYGFQLSSQDAADSVSTLRKTLVDVGRNQASVEVTITPDQPLNGDLVHEYAAAGVDRLVVIAEGKDLAEVENVVRQNSPDRLIG